MPLNHQEIFVIPVEDNFLIYNPLKQIAFIGNIGMVNVIQKYINGENSNSDEEKKVLSALSKSGFFKPKKRKVPSSSINSKLFMPTACVLMPTTACNLACTYCYATYEGKKTEYLSWAIAKKAIDICYSNSKRQMNSRFSLSFHGGGEPSLSQELFFRAAYYSRKLDPSCRISITSNCIWNEKFRKEAIGLLNEVSVSLDGAKTTQDRQRPDKNGNGTFVHVMNTIRDLELNRIPYGIRMTVNKDSVPELVRNIDFITNITSCKSIQVEPVYNQGKASKLDSSIRDVKLFTDSFLEGYYLAKSRGVRLSYSSARPHIITNTFCKANSKALIVTSRGEITACYEVFDQSHPFAKDFIIGSLNNGKGVHLFPEKRVELLKKIKDNMDQCKDCFCYYHCAGDCPPKAFLNQGMPDNFRCSVTREITRELILDRMSESKVGTESI